MKALIRHALTALLRHSLWIIPLSLGLMLWTWTYIVPLDDTNGREFLAILFFVISAFVRIFVHVETRREARAAAPVIHVKTAQTRDADVSLVWHSRREA